MNTYIKDPGAVLDYAFDWSGWLEPTETITAHTVTIDPAGSLTNDSATETGGIVTVWLSGGTLDARYCVTSHITTSHNRQDERSITVAVHNR
jgi:hypothetical protein